MLSWSHYVGHSHFGRHGQDIVMIQVKKLVHVVDKALVCEWHLTFACGCSSYGGWEGLKVVAEK